MTNPAEVSDRQVTCESEIRIPEVSDVTNDAPFNKSTRHTPKHKHYRPDILQIPVPYPGLHSEANHSHFLSQTAPCLLKYQHYYSHVRKEISIRITNMKRRETGTLTDANLGMNLSERCRKCKPSSAVRIQIKEERKEFRWHTFQCTVLLKNCMTNQVKRSLQTKKDRGSAEGVSRFWICCLVRTGPVQPRPE